MDATEYYITTLTNAFKTLGPYFIFFVGGYLVFIKLPFLFLKKSMDDQKKNLQNANLGVEFIDREKSRSKPKQVIVEIPLQGKKRTENKKQETIKPTPGLHLSAEEIMGFKPYESFTKDELKKKYFELLKQNHPDRVGTMGPDFKKLAEKNTKDINHAYEKLKKRAA